MKTRKLFTLLLIMACLFTNCSDSDKDIEEAIKPPTEKEKEKEDEDEDEDENEVDNNAHENDIIKLSDTHSIIRLKTLSGRPEGAVQGADREEFIKAIDKIDDSEIRELKKTSIRFIKNTDKLMIKGYLHALSTSPTTIEKEMQYKFEDDKLLLHLVDGWVNPIWFTYGYGTKEKIDVYKDLKTICHHQEEENDTPWFESNYSIENITTTMFMEDIESSVLNWNVFFERTSSLMPHSTCPKSKDEMKHPSQGVAWSLHKLTIYPTETEK